MASLLWSLLGSRDLARALVWRELVVRYKRSVLGIGWALVEPLVMVVTYVVVFGQILGAARSVDNYALFALLGSIPWFFMAGTLEQGGGTLLEHANLARKIRFPWELLIGAVVLSRFTTLLIGVVLALCAAIVFAMLGADIRWTQLWLLPIGIVEMFLFVAGLALIVGALQVVVRDTLFLVRFVLRVGFYAVPAVYPLHIVPPSIRGWYELDPIVGMLWCFQAFVAPIDAAPSSLSQVVALVASIATFAAGWALFRRLRPIVADLL